MISVTDAFVSMTRRLPRPLDPLGSFKSKVSLIVGLVLAAASNVSHEQKTLTAGTNGIWPRPKPVAH